MFAAAGAAGVLNSTGGCGARVVDGGVAARPSVGAVVGDDVGRLGLCGGANAPAGTRVADGSSISMSALTGSRALTGCGKVSVVACSEGARFGFASSSFTRPTTS